MHLPTLVRRATRLVLSPLDWILRAFVLPQNVLVVAGDRRSGNHACIYWILSCLAGRDILAAHGKRSGPGMRHYPDEHIVFINDITNIRSLAGIRGLVTRYWRVMREASFVLLSFEDVSPEAICGHGLLGRLKTIRVQRNLPDLLASRYESLVRLAMEGEGHQQHFSMTRFWFRNLACWRKMSLVEGSNSDLIFWSYDRWKHDPIYRKDFLHSIGIDRDVFPIGLSGEGFGSSFGVSTDSADRLKSVSFQQPFKVFLKKATQLVPECFSPEDIERVSRYLADADADKPPHRGSYG
jgi:hypothetical protein